MTQLGKQARVLTDGQILRAIGAASEGVNADRDVAILLLTIRAGLRPCEVARLTWGMVLDSAGAVGDALALESKASKGGYGGRVLTMHPLLKGALVKLYRGQRADARVIVGERGTGMSANNISQWLRRFYASLGFRGCSAYSGRRTFITRSAQKIIEAGGTLRDVQQLAGHASIQTTQRYIEANPEAQRKVITAW